MLERKLLKFYLPLATFGRSRTCRFGISAFPFLICYSPFLFLILGMRATYYSNRRRITEYRTVILARGRRNTKSNPRPITTVGVARSSFRAVAQRKRRPTQCIFGASVKRWYISSYYVACVYAYAAVQWLA